MPPASFDLRFESTLSAPVERVWARVGTFAGVNDELRPLLRMTAPAGTTLTPDDAPIGRPWFRSWLLLGGVLPIDFDHLRLVAIDPPHGFHERSTMLSAAVWEHRRTLTEAGPEETRLVDELHVEPRAPFGPILRRAVPVVFRYRHERLRARFGATS